MATEEGDEISILLEIIKECREDFKEGVVHNFYGSEAQLKRFLELGLSISISGIITYEKYVFSRIFYLIIYASLGMLVQFLLFLKSRRTNLCCAQIPLTTLHKVSCFELKIFSEALDINNILPILLSEHRKMNPRIYHTCCKFVRRYLPVPLVFHT